MYLMNPNVIQIILESIMILLGFYLAFFKSYFEERGRIVATKKDIDEITKKIELVKSDVEILTHKKISLSSEKQNCLLEYYDKLNNWLNYITYLDLTDHSESPDVYFLQVQERLNKLYHDYLSAETKVEIFFIRDQDLLSAKYFLKIPAMELSSLARQYLIKARTEAKVFQIILSSPDILSNNSIKHNQIFESGQKQVIIIKEYEESRKELIKTVSELNYKLLEIINDRVINLI